MWDKLWKTDRDVDAMPLEEQEQTSTVRELSFVKADVWKA
jgi:hypothetical protein